VRAVSDDFVPFVEITKVHTLAKHLHGVYPDPGTLYRDKTLRNGTLQTDDLNLLGDPRISGLGSDRKEGFVIGQRKFHRKRRMVLVGSRRSQKKIPKLVQPCLGIGGRPNNDVVNSWRRIMIPSTFTQETS
jgi:hypothetical protein